MFLYYYDVMRGVVFRCDTIADMYQSFNSLIKDWMDDDDARLVAEGNVDYPVLPVTYDQSLLLVEGKSLADALLV